MNFFDRAYQKLTQTHLHGYDPILLGATALLCLTGVLMIYSASSSLSDRMFGTSLIFLRNHRTLLGFCNFRYERLDTTIDPD